MKVRLILALALVSTLAGATLAVGEDRGRRKAITWANGVEPAIEGPTAGTPVVPVAIDIDLSVLPVEVPLRLSPRLSPIEVPLQEVPGDEYYSRTRRQQPMRTSKRRFVKEDRDGLGRLKTTPPEFSTPNPTFDGIELGDPGAGFIPPDTNGDVGPNHYVQTVNSAIAIFDKRGNTLAGPMPINTLFGPLGGPCATGSVIDPIVNHDPLADRWVVLGFPFSSPICIAVSRTNDPVTGGWFLYAFDVTDLGFPDYPKLGVWRDAYYLTTQRGFPGGGLDVYALDRAKMLRGGAATFVHFFVAPPSLFLLPADVDGRSPRKGAPAPFVRHVDGEQWGGVDRLEVFEFSVNFQNPQSSTFDLVVGLPTAPFSAILCGDNFFGNCAEQPNGTRLETLPAWLMWRAQYRNFRKHETLVANHTIDVDNVLDERAGIRWYELRRRHGRSWFIRQQGTFAPQNPAASSFLHRWMGSIAMDKQGNMALGFSASSSTVFPGVRYVGRKVNDRRGSMPRGGEPDGDFIMMTGAGSQFETRWGDYSSMSVDPVDGCTFWYTQEYIGTADSWRTRVGAFKFPSCLGEDDHHEDFDDKDKDDDDEKDDDEDDKDKD